MTVFPIPASCTDQLTIRFGDMVKGDILIQLYSLNGNVVYQTHINKDMKALEFKLPLKEFSRGIYLLRAENRGFETTQKVIIE